MSYLFLSMQCRFSTFQVFSAAIRISSPLCRYRSALIHASLCLSYAVHVHIASLPCLLKASLFSSLPSPLLAILCSSVSAQFFANAFLCLALPFPCITDLCFAFSNQLPSTPFLFHCLTSHLLTLPSRLISVLSHAAASLRCRRAS